MKFPNVVSVCVPVALSLWVVAVTCCGAVTGQEAKPAASAPAPAPAAGEIPGFTALGLNAQGRPEYRHAATGLTFVAVPGGSFDMGSPPDEVGRFVTEGPVRRVTAKPFLICKTELTQSAWIEVMGSKPWWGGNYTRNGDDYPATAISWDDCRSFNTRAGLRFPSEAEWEYACRAGSSERYCFGDDEKLTGDYAWYEPNTWNIGARSTNRTGLKKPNGWGLLDVHGNVAEWVEDTWHVDYSGAPTDGSAWVDVEHDARRILRGGSWLYDAWTVRCATRICNVSSFGTDHLGYRPAASIPQQNK